MAGLGEERKSWGHTGGCGKALPTVGPWASTPQMASLAHAQLSPAWEVAWAWEGGDWPHSPMEPRTGVAVVASCCQLVSELSCQGF